MKPGEFDDLRRYVTTDQGRIAYYEKGSGPPALFLHAYALNGFQWRDIVEPLSASRRCIALDVLGMGHTEAKRGQDLSLKSQAEMVGAFLDELRLDRVDLVGNDSGGGICQVFAARNPSRVSTMTLTNSEVHDNYPPPGLQPLIGAAQQGAFGGILRGMLENPDSARGNMGVALYEHPERAFDDEAVKVYLAPLVRSQEAIDDITRYTAEMNPKSTIEIEPQLRELEVPTLIVWGTGDEIFPIRWAHWLRDAIPGCEEIIEVPGGKLCFPEEHPNVLVDSLQKFWKA